MQFINRFEGSTEHSMRIKYLINQENCRVFYYSIFFFSVLYHKLSTVSILCPYIQKVFRGDTSAFYIFIHLLYKGDRCYQSAYMKTLRGSLQCYKEKKMILKVMMALVLFIEECPQSLSLTVTKYPELRLTSLTAWAAPGAGCMQPNRKESWGGLTSKVFPASYCHKGKAVEYFSG